MSNSLNCILDRMCEIVHWVDAPFVSGVVVCHMCHTVDNRISHIDVRRCHIDLGTQNFRSVLELTVFHPFKQIQVLFHASVTVRAVLSWLCQGSAVLADLLCCQVTDKCFSFFDQLDGCFIHLVKIVGCEEQAVFPVSSQPFYICFDGLYKLDFFFCRVGIVETQVEFSVIFLRKTIV